MIAYDIHDGIVQDAADSLMFLEGYKGQRVCFYSDPDEPTWLLNALVIADGRRMMNGIRPPLRG